MEHHIETEDLREAQGAYPPDFDFAEYDRWLEEQHEHDIEEREQ